jgi:mRNA interferase MazF
MSIRKGEIYLANLGNKQQQDIGKIRPVLIFQNNMLNKTLQETNFKDVVILPLSSKIRENDFCYFVPSSNNLQKDSVVLCNAIKMIHFDRLLLDKGILTTLSHKQVKDIEKILYNLLECSL